MILPLSWRWITNDRIDMRALGIILSDRDNNINRYSKFTSSSDFTILSIPQIGSTFPNSWKHSCHKYYCNCIPLNQYMAILIKVIMKSNGQDVKPSMHWVLWWWRKMIENSLHDVILNIHSILSWMFKLCTTTLRVNISGWGEFRWNSYTSPPCFVMC